MPFPFFCFPLSHSLFLLCQWVRPFGSSCANKCVAEAITPATPHHTVTVPLLTPFPCSHLCTLLHRAFDRAWCPPPQSTAVSTPATPHHAVTVPLLTPISLFTSMYILASCIRLCLVPAPPKHSGEHSCHAPSHRDGATAHPLWGPFEPSACFVLGQSRIGGASAQGPGFRAKAAEATRLRIESSFPECRGGWGRHEWILVPWVLHAPGARMTVVNTNSLKLI